MVKNPTIAAWPHCGNDYQDKIDISDLDIPQDIRDTINWRAGKYIVDNQATT